MQMKDRPMAFPPLAKAFLSWEHPMGSPWIPRKSAVCEVANTDGRGAQECDSRWALRLAR